MKKASVVAALVSDSRRGGVGRRGGESIADAFIPSPMDSLLIRLRCLRSSWPRIRQDLPSFAHSFCSWDIGIYLFFSLRALRHPTKILVLALPDSK